MLLLCGVFGRFSLNEGGFSLSVLSSDHKSLIKRVLAVSLFGLALATAAIAQTAPETALFM
jgi:hypothetical protein